MPEAEEEKSVGSVYQEAEAKLVAFKDNDLHGNDPKKLKLAEEAFVALNNAHRIIDVVSSNEELDDVATADLKFLLCTFQLGDLVLEMPGKMENRPDRVKRGYRYLKEFLDQQEQLGLLTKAQKDSLAQAMTGQPATREARIAGFRQEQDLEKRLKELTEQREARLRARKKMQVARSRGVVGSARDDEDRDETDNDDEHERKYWLCVLEDAVMKAISHIRFAKRELQMIQMHELAMKAREQSQSSAASITFGPGSRAAGPAGAPPRTRPMAVHHIASSKDLNRPIPEHMQKFMIPVQQAPPAAQAAAAAATPLPAHRSGAAERRQLAAESAEMDRLLGRGIAAMHIDQRVAQRAQAEQKIFREFNPPTKTMDQWFAEEQGRGLLPSDEDIARFQQQQALRKSEDHVSEDEDSSGEEEALMDRDDQIADRATMEAREWDNWKDEHERGIGNRMNR